MKEGAKINTKTFEYWMNPHSDSIPGMYSIEHGQPNKDWYRAIVTVTPIEEKKPMEVHKREGNDLIRCPKCKGTAIKEVNRKADTECFCVNCDTNFICELPKEKEQKPVSPPRLRLPSEPWDGKDYYLWTQYDVIGGWQKFRRDKPPREYIPAAEFEAWLKHGEDQAAKIAELEKKLKANSDLYQRNLSNNNRAASRRITDLDSMVGFLNKQIRGLESANAILTKAKKELTAENERLREAIASLTLSLKEANDMNTRLLGQVDSLCKEYHVMQGDKFKDPPVLSGDNPPVGLKVRMCILLV